MKGTKAGLRGKKPAGKKQGQGQGVLDMMQQGGAFPGAAVVRPDKAPASFSSSAARRGPPPAQSHSFVFPSRAGGMEDTLRQGLQKLDGAPFVAFFSDRGGCIRQLWLECGRPSSKDMSVRFGAWGEGIHKKVGHVVAVATQAMVDVHDGSFAAGHAAMIAAVKNLNQYLDDSNSGNTPSPVWMIPFLGPIFNLSRKVALLCEAQEGQKGKRVDEMMSVVLASLNKLVRDRNPTLTESKKIGLVTTCNNLFKAAFYTNNMGVISAAVKIENNSSFPILKVASTAQRVTYHYYTGRYQMLEQCFAEAEQSLTQAFELCHTGYRKNQIRILIFLVTVKLVQGKFPTDHLLRTYGLDTILKPLVDTIKAGNVAKFDKCMEQNASFFAKLGIYVLLHRARLHCYFVHIRRVHHVIRLLSPDDAYAQTRLKIPLVVSTFAAAGDGMIVNYEDIECALVSLMANQQIKGYISREHELVILSKKSPFPTSEP